MRRMFLLFLILGMLFISTGCASTDLCSTNNLRKIHIALDLVRNAPHDKDFEADLMCCSASALVGLSFAQIESCLGTPGHLDDHFYYVFYKFAEPDGEGWFTLGGGPELWLQFDQDNICISARFVETQ
jgi:hypothetical protein